MVEKGVCGKGRGKTMPERPEHAGSSTRRPGQETMTGDQHC